MSLNVEGVEGNTTRGLGLISKMSHEHDDAEKRASEERRQSEQYFATVSPSQQPRQRRLPSAVGQSIGDDSGMFLSDPSVSEEGESRIRAPHRSHAAMPFQRNQQYDPDDTRRGMISPQAFAQPSPVPSSPGNTSLSSWESPAVRQQVLLQFTPERKVGHVRLDKNANGVAVRVVPAISTSRVGEVQLPYLDTSGQPSSCHPGSQAPPIPSMNTSDQPLDPNSTRSGSLGHFLHGLRFRSAGALRPHQAHDHVHDELQSADPYANKSRLALPNSRLQGLRQSTDPFHVNAGETNGMVVAAERMEHVPNNDFAREVEVPIATSDRDSRLPPSSIYESQRTADISIAMSLSDSENEVDQSTTLEGIEHAGEDSADDEKTNKRLPRGARVHATGKGPVSHRRIRSGDEAAATLATGGTDWKGMEQDRIPIPEDDFGGDDDDTDSGGNLKQRWLQAASRRFPSQGSIPSAQDEGNWEGTPSSFRRSDRDESLLYSQSSSEKPVSVSNGGPQLDTPSETAESEFDTSEYGGYVHRNRLQYPSDDYDLSKIEQQFEDRQFRGTYQNVLRPNTRRTSFTDSPFANIGKKSSEKASRSFVPKSSVIVDDPKAYETYMCPRCRTIQRTFFTVNDAPRQLESAAGYLAFYFTVYVVSSLFIFGLEEGWHPLDCIYFAVVTLTTAGLGDFVPTTDANKIICSIFIYFGVACIGLLLGSYIAGMQDDKAIYDARAKQLNSCPNCARLQLLRDAAAKASTQSLFNPVAHADQPRQKMPRHMSERTGIGKLPVETHSAVYVSIRHHKHRPGRSPSQTTDSSRKSPDFSNRNVQLELTPSMPEPKHHLEVSATSPLFEQIPSPNTLGSPMTRQILGRQSHTRHSSMDLAGQQFFAAGSLSSGAKTYGSMRPRGFSADLGQPPPTISETTTFNQTAGNTSVPAMQFDAADYDDIDRYSEFDDDDDDSMYSMSSSSSLEEFLDERRTKIRTAKYVFLTLRQALVNSMVIIAVGCIGFWLIEGFSLVDSWYFTTVFLTTVGYGDITPRTRGGKLFATCYILVAGTILLNNMSMIALIPLELRKRRVERAVLTQFGDQLDDAALRELATGPLIQRLHLAASRDDGLDECTREMFSLAMLVRLGKVSEHDIRETFASFRRLDVNDEGVLNSKSIIAAMIQKKRMFSMHGGTLPSSRHGSLPSSRHGSHRSTQRSRRRPPPPPPSQNHQPPMSQQEPPDVLIDNSTGLDNSNLYGCQDSEAGATTERSSLLQHHQAAPDGHPRLSSPTGPPRTNSQESPF